MRGKLFRGGVVFCGLLVFWWLLSNSGIPAFLSSHQNKIGRAHV